MFKSIYQPILAFTKHDQMTEKDQSTEEKIKAAARDLFHQRGFDGTKTRDIAEAAGINLALMNYYFRSKKKLFDLIMMETIERFFKSVLDIIREEDDSMEQKIQKLTSHYITLLKQEPDLPIFILSEVRSNPSFIFDQVFKDNDIGQTPFFQFLRQSIGQDTSDPSHPAHILLNLISMIVFPFAAKPLIMYLLGLDEEQFHHMMDQRRELIPVWLHKLLPSDELPNLKNHEN